jgi:hypothetical protein
VSGVCSKGSSGYGRYRWADLLLLQSIVCAQVSGETCALAARVTRVGQFFFFVEFERDLALIGGEVKEW